MADFDPLDLELEGLETTMEGTRAMTRAFAAEIESVRGALSTVNVDLATFEKGLSGGLKSAFNGVVFQGFELRDALNALSESLSRAVYNAALNPVVDGVAATVTQGIGDLIGVSGFADGGAFMGGRVTPFAKGGVVSQATTFPMRGGLGLMGEAGPEAIMPLTRGSDGSLGVRAQGGAAANVTINVSTPDVGGFQRSQGQIAAQVNRALARGQRNA